MVVIFCLILTQHSQSESGETDIFLENSTFPPSSSKTVVMLTLNLQGAPDGEYKYVLVYQDHLTKYCRLRPLKTKQATEIAHNLMDFFCDLGAPLLLHSDNGR